MDLSQALVLALDRGRRLERGRAGGEQLVVRRRGWEELRIFFFDQEKRKRRTVSLVFPLGYYDLKSLLFRQ
jgi:hypothetical protein